VGACPHRREGKKGLFWTGWLLDELVDFIGRVGYWTSWLLDGLVIGRDSSKMHIPTLKIMNAYLYYATSPDPTILYL